MTATCTIITGASSGIGAALARVDFPWQMAWLVGLARYLPTWLWDQVGRAISPGGKKS